MRFALTGTLDPSITYTARASASQFRGRAQTGTPALPDTSAQTHAPSPLVFRLPESRECAPPRLTASGDHAPRLFVRILQSPVLRSHRCRYRLHIASEADVAD